MKIKPTRYQIDNGPGIGIEVEIDSESTSDGPVYFEISQDSETIVITEQAASDLVIAMKMLIEGRK
jgi:hypothetical protein